MNNEVNEHIKEKDINDIFDEILLTEENLTETSYRVGFAEGTLAGNPEGYHLGYHRGAELGAELGYYSGVISIYLKKSNSDKITKILLAIDEAIESFPKTNDENVDIFMLIDKIRGQYRKVCSLLKINGKYPEADSLNF